MGKQSKVSGVVLAGGLARRMQMQDKGLLIFRDRPLVSYPLAAISPLVDDLMISANRNSELYSQFGYPVIADHSDSFDGPLAGILAAMQAAKNPLLLVSPCDSPLVQSLDFQRLLAGLSAEIDIAVAYDGERLHPVFLALKTGLQTDLFAYLRRGERKLESWLRALRLAKIDFSDRPQIFANINTPAELKTLENKYLI